MELQLLALSLGCLWLIPEPEKRDQQIKVSAMVNVADVFLPTPPPPFRTFLNQRVKPRSQNNTQLDAVKLSAYFAHLEL